MSGALAGRHTDKELEKGRVENTRVTRYWPGKKPDWVNEDDPEEALVRGVQRTAIAAPVIVKKTDDPRLARLAQRRVDREAAVQEHRQIRAAEIVRKRSEADEDAVDKAAGSEEDESESDEEGGQQEEVEEDEEEMQRRRDALRERCRTAATEKVHQRLSSCTRLIRHSDVQVEAATAAT
jgi:microfibrillar-associated protein 1